MQSVQPRNILFSGEWKTIDLQIDDSKILPSVVQKTEIEIKAMGTPT